MSPNDIWKGIFDSELVTTITLPAFLSCLLVSVLLGFVIAFTFSQKAGSTKSFLISGCSITKQSLYLLTFYKF